MKTIRGKCVVSFRALYNIKPVRWLKLKRITEVIRHMKMKKDFSEFRVTTESVVTHIGLKKKRGK